MNVRSSLFTHPRGGIIFDAKVRWPPVKSRSKLMGPSGCFSFAKPRPRRKRTGCIPVPRLCMASDALCSKNSEGAPEKRRIPRQKKHMPGCVCVCVCLFLGTYQNKVWFMWFPCIQPQGGYGRRDSQPSVARSEATGVERPSWFSGGRDLGR